MTNLNYTLLLVAVPLGMAFLLPIIGLAGKRLVKWAVFLTLAFNLLYALQLLAVVLQNGSGIAVIGNWRPPFGINFYLSPSSLLFAVVIYFVGVMASLMFMAQENSPIDEKLGAGMLLTIMAAGTIALTGDIFNMFVFIEILSIGTTILISARREGLSFLGSLKYLVLAGIGSAMFLFAIGFIYGTLGTLNLAEIGMRFVEVNFYVASFILLMFLGAILVESEGFPFNLWVPDAYEGSFAYINSILSGVVATAGMFALMKVFLQAFGVNLTDKVMYYSHLNFNTILLVIGVLTTVIGEFSALTQKNVKRILAYSSMAQMGIVLFALGLATKTAVVGGVFHLVNHAVSKGLLFLALSMMITKVGSADIDALAGLGRKSRFLVILFVIGAFGIIGFPFFNGFWSKMYIINAAVEFGGWGFLAVSFILGAALVEIFYYFRIIYKLFNPVDVAIKAKVHPVGYVALVVLAFVVLYVGIHPAEVANLVGAAADDLFDKTNMLSTVLGSGVVQ